MLPFLLLDLWAQPSVTIEDVRSAVVAAMPKHGTVLAEYSSEGLGGNLLIGYDCGARAWYQVYGGNIWGATPSGEYFTGRESAGTTKRRPNEVHRLNAPDEYIPTLFLLEVLDHSDRIRSVDRIDGGFRVTAEYPSGSVMYPPTNQGTTTVQTIILDIAEDGRLLHETNENHVLEHSTDYAPQSLGTLPVVATKGDPVRGWKLTSYKFLPDGDPSLFAPEAVERMAIGARTGTRTRMLTGTAASTPGTSVISGSSRDHAASWGLILGGFTVMAVGGLGWWHRRRA